MFYRSKDYSKVQTNRTNMTLDDLIQAARQLDTRDFGYLRRTLHAISRTGLLLEGQNLLTEAARLPMQDFETFCTTIDQDFNERVAQYTELTPEERDMLAACSRHGKIDCIKLVRRRTGLGLADSKELVDRWLALRDEA